jgi:hypothetical protein
MYVVVDIEINLSIATDCVLSRCTTQVLKYCNILPPTDKATNAKTRAYNVISELVIFL